jgi:hypothetical protein
MIRIAITEAAFEAVAATLPLGSVAYGGGRLAFYRSGDFSTSLRRSSASSRSSFKSAI